MYTSIRQYHAAPGDIAEIAHRVDETFADQLAKVRGFVAYELLDCGDGTAFTLTVFEDRQSAEASAEMAAEWIRDALGDLEIRRTAVYTGEVLVNRAERKVLEMVHA